jgi:SAM-dependent methyltransferase
MIAPALLEQLEATATAGGEEALYPALRALSLRGLGELLLDVPERCPSLRALLPRMPADEIQIAWTGNAGPALLEQSLHFVGAVSSGFLELTGRPLEGARILDYGCGWGRLLRLMYRFSGPDRIYGCDAWTSSLDLCRSLGIRAHLAQSQEIPRDAPFPGVPFDLAYAFSVFTHLSERTARAVADALRRSVSPGGLAALTIRPLGYWDAHSQQQSTVDTGRMKREHLARGFAFAPHNRPQVDGEVTYGDTSISLEYIARSWPGWTVAHHLLDPVDPWQQLLFLRPA